MRRTKFNLPEASIKSSPPWLLAGTFMVARMLCRSLSWMGCVGLAAAAATEDTAGVEGVVAVGEAAEVAEGVMGVVGTWEEPSRLAAEVEVGVTAVDGLWMEIFSKTLCKITIFCYFCTTERVLLIFC